LTTAVVRILREIPSTSESQSHMNTEQARICDLAQIRAGYQTRQRVKTTTGGTHLLLQLRDINDQRTEVDLARIARIVPNTISEEQLLRDGDIIFLAKGPRNFSLLPRGLPRPALAASYFFVIRPTSRIVPEYLSWYLNLDSTRRMLSRYASQGAHMPIIRRKVLEDVEVPLPDVATQRRIVKLTTLGDEQHRLLTELAHKQRLLATAACLRATHASVTDRDHR
jgi:hypothetical protein